MKKTSRFLRVFRWLHVNCGIGWYRVPTTVLKLAYLAKYRDLLRAENLHDTAISSSARALPVQPRPSWRYLHARSPDGSYNDLDMPAMGRVETRFGRNIPPASSAAETSPGVAQPSPYDVSEQLLSRAGEFKPAEPINLLAAAWIQFMVHDWMDHGRTKDPFDKVEVRVGAEHFVDVLCTLRDQTRDRVPVPPCPTFLNRATHWWDGSQIYGSLDHNRSSEEIRSNEDALRRLRAGENGKLRVESGLLPVAPGGKAPPVERGDVRPLTDDTGVRANWWLGLGLVHTLFVLEHNAICDALHDTFPHWDDDDLYDHARLVNTALMAKIQTVEWTPAVLNHPAIVTGMHGNWWGLAAEYLHRLTGRLRDDISLALHELLPGISRSEVFGGIRGSSTDHHGSPYAITEEFVSIYRMHPLIPDALALYSLGGGRPEMRQDLDAGIIKYAFKHTGRILEETGLTMPELFYSFGVAHPGALVLNNFPEALRNIDIGRMPELKEQLERFQHGPDRIDVGMVDIIRDRERGVPRYNDFRALMHLPRIRSFDELLPGDGQRALREKVAAMYGDPDKVDLMVGLLAEPKPDGFAFSNTAFVVFVLMASRRLKSDRFFSSDYRPEVYTQLGLDWIDANGMKSVLLRHYPELAPHLEGVVNPFAPWTRRVRAAGAGDARAPGISPAVRVRIPMLLDVVLVKDHALAARLNDHPRIDRLPTGAGGLINRIVQRRSERELRTREGPLPAFAGRDDARRRRQQAEIGARLSGFDLSRVNEEVRVLARYVRGDIELDETGVGVVAQGLAARVLGADYPSSPQTFQDARTLSDWHRLFSWPPRRRRARQRLWAAAGGDDYVIHGTTFAVHNLVEALAEMRRFAGLCGDGPPPEARQVAARCLVAPQRVLRIVQADIELDELDRPLRRGTILILLLRRIHGGTRLDERAFSRGAWSECPAHGLVPRLLAAIWNAAIERPGDQSRS